MNDTKLNEISTKIFFIKYGICLLFLSLVLGILIYTTTIANRSWKNNLRNSVYFCLNEKQPGNWTLGEFIELDNPFSTSCACYKAIKKDSDANYYAVIARITTFYGPMNCVFIYEPEGEVTFIGPTMIHGRIKERISETFFSVRIRYFSERIPLILKNVEEK